MKQGSGWVVAAALATFGGGVRTASAQACEDHGQCGSFQACIDGECAEVEPSGEPCEVDDDCIDGACLDGMCWEASGETSVDPVPPEECDPDDGTCASPEPGCEDGDEECGGIPPEGICESDADCGSGQVCMGCFCTEAEGTCASDDDCGPSEKCERADVAVSGGTSDGSEEGGGDEPVECSFDRGWCVLDLSKVEADPRCDAFCDAVSACEGEAVEGGGSSGEGSAPVPIDETDEATDTDEGALDEDDRQECIGYCSYLLQDADAGEALANLVTCVEEHAGDGCEALADSCGAEVEAVAEASDDVAVATGGPARGEAGGGDGGEQASGAPDSAGDVFRGLFHGNGADDGDGNGGGGGAGGNAGADDGGDDDDDGGCNVLPTESTSALGLFAVGLLGVFRSRRRR